MDCPSCRKDLSRFQHLHKFCPLCSAPLREGTGGGTGNPVHPVPERAMPRDMARASGVEGPERAEDPLFDIYWKDEIYKAGRSNALEISLAPGAELAEVSVKARLLSLGLVIERETLPYARKNTSLYFYFKPETAGRHIAKLAVTCHDRKGDPTVFETEDFVFHVDEEEKEKEGPTTYNIGDIIAAGEVSLGVTRATERRGGKEEESEMVRLELFYNDAETRKMRRLARVDQMMTEGRRLFDEGSGLVESTRRPLNRKNEVMGDAIALLGEAKNRFLHVRQEDPTHEESLRYMERIKDLMGGSRVSDAPKDEEPRKRFSSCALRLPGEGAAKRVFLFSKEAVTIGKDESNDIAFPDMEYISGKHALIKVSPRGEFFVRDVGTGGTGSRNGTFLNAGESGITPQKDYPILDGTIINLGKSLGLFCRFLRGPAKYKPDPAIPEGAATVTGGRGDGSSPMDTWGMVNAVKLKPGNPGMGDEYIILLGEITVGAGSANGLVIKGDRISEIHMRILYRDGLYMIEDLNSPAGVFLNGFKLDPGVEYALKEDAVVTLGGVDMGLELRG
jgi:pSer/pThr/pTyr-binding forkhead associated (FHA) protein